ncbi:MAG: potassium-transporting ATPase subunit KdpC [Nakamurella sp.]
MTPDTPDPRTSSTVEVTPLEAGPSSITAASAVRQSLIGLRFLLAMTVLVGVLYPAVVYGIGRLMPDRADGSMVTDATGVAVGSSLIGQSFTDPQWFTGRPSAAGSDGYDALSSGGSNLAADSADLAQLIAERRTEVAKLNGVPESAVPADAITSSASGLDPDISPAYARLQVARVAKERGLAQASVAAVVEAHVNGRLLGFLGDEHVNVLELNLALQRLTG